MVELKLDSAMGKGGYMLENLVKDTPPESKSDVYETISRKDLKVAWLAGFFDGEGCIYAKLDKSPFKRNQGKVLEVVMKITNTHMPSLRKVSEILTENKIGYYYAINSVRFSSLGIHVNGQGRCEKLAKLLLPYLVTKKKQAELVLELVERRREIGFTKRGVNTQSFTEDEKINSLIKEIKRLKWIRQDPRKCSRIANKPLGIPRDYTPSTQKSEDIVQSL